VIGQAEVVRQEGQEPKDHPRFLMTNWPQRPQGI